jgi:dihydropteroate synthase
MEWARERKLFLSLSSALDLLRLKEKRRRDIPYDRSIEKQGSLRVLEAKRGAEPISDKKGSFEITVDQDENKVVVSHFKVETELLDFMVRGSRRLEVRDVLNRLDCYSTLEHAYYLGMEVEKAYIASRINRSY